MKIEPSVLIALGIVLVSMTVLVAMKIAPVEVFTNVAIAVIAWLAPSPAKKEVL